MYSLEDNGFFKCNYYPIQTDNLTQFFIDLYYQVASTRNSNGDINYSIMIELSRIYNLNNDEFMLLKDLVEIGNNIYFEKMKEDMKNKTK